MTTTLVKKIQEFPPNPATEDYPVRLNQYLERQFRLLQNSISSLEGDTPTTTPPYVPPVPTGSYSVTVTTPDRTFDASATTLNELANVLATLINDLKTRGELG